MIARSKSMHTASAHVLGSVSVQGISVLITFAIDVLLANNLGIEQYGAFFAIIYASSLVVIPLNAGIQTTFPYVLNNRVCRPGTLLTSILLFPFFVCFVNGLLSFGIMPIVAWFLRPYPIPPHFTIWWLLYIPVCIIRLHIIWYLLGVGQVHASNAVLLVQSVLRLAFVSSFLYLFETDLFTVLWAYILSSLLAVSLSILLALWFLDDTLRLPSPRMMLFLYRFGFTNSLAGLAQTLLLTLNLFVVGALLDLHSVGIYALANRLNSILLTGIKAALRPMRYHFAVAKHHTVYKRLRKCVVWIALISAMFFSVYILVGRWFIVSVYGYEFVNSFTILLIILPGTCFYTLCLLYHIVLVARNLHDEVFIGYLFGCLFLFVLSSILIPNYGLVGAAVSFTFSLLGSFCLIVRVFSHRFLQSQGSPGVQFDFPSAAKFGPIDQGGG